MKWTVEERRGVANDIESVREDIEERRRTRPKVKWMPEELWKRAAILARVHGVSRISEELNLHYTRLKERSEGPKATESTSATFVELEPGTVFDDARGKKANVEVTGNDGSTMTLHLPLGWQDAGELVEAFFGRAR